MAWVLLLWLGLSQWGNVHTGDTDILVRGAQVTRDCLDDDVRRACGLRPGTRYTDAGPYPLLQYVPALIALDAGVGEPDVVELLARVNVVAFVGAVGLCLLAGRRKGPVVGYLGVVALLAGTATYQATAGFGEMLAAAACLAVVVAAICDRPWLLGIAMVVACQGKETLFPFLVGLAVAVALVPGERPDWRRLVRRTFVPAVAGAMVGVAVASLFNVFRFGTASNLFYLDPTYRSPDLARTGRHLALLVVSPQAGVAAFWPVATLVLVACAGIAVADAGRRRRWSAAVRILPVAVLFGFLLGVAAWYTPFGWIAVGPRLAVPLLPAATVAALAVNADVFGRWWAAVAGRAPVLLLVLAIAIGLGWPSFGSPWSQKAATARLVAGDATCPPLPTVVLQDDADRYFSCADHFALRTRPSVLAALATKGGSDATAGRLFAASGVLTGGLVAAMMADGGSRRRRQGTAATRNSD